jgi:hypothetical protein
MLQVVSVIIQCVIATSLMTAFSYGLSLITRKQLREPELLNKVLNPAKPATRIAGWLIHYLVGLLFIVIYQVTFATTHPTFAVYLLAGGLSGLGGIAAWFTVLNIHPHPPAVDRVAFYIQLLPAHVVFAIGAYLWQGI